VENLGILNNM